MRQRPSDRPSRFLDPTHAPQITLKRFAQQLLLPVENADLARADDVVYAREPYSADTGRDTFNESDNIYVEEGELTLAEEGECVVGLITLDVKRS